MLSLVKEAVGPSLAATAFYKVAAYTWLKNSKEDFWFPVKVASFVICLEAPTYLKGMTRVGFAKE